MRNSIGIRRGDIVAAKSDGVVKQYVAIRPTLTTPPGPDWQLAEPVDDGGLWSGIDGRDGSDGVDGKNGVDGRDGVDGVDGRGYTYRGTWNPRLSYVVNDTVSLDGSTYVAIAENSRREPDEFPQFWALMAVKGERGLRGEPGGAGQRGRSSIPLQNEILQRLEEIESGGSAGSELLPLIFDSAATRGLVLYASTDGHCDLATAADHPGAIGLCNSDAVTSGNAGLVNPDGVIELEQWTDVAGSPLLNPGTVYYLSPSVPGQITSTAPTTPGQYVVVVGRAVSATALAIEIDSPVLL